MRHKRSEVLPFYHRSAEEGNQFVPRRERSGQADLIPHHRLQEKELISLDLPLPDMSMACMWTARDDRGTRIWGEKRNAPFWGISVT